MEIIELDTKFSYLLLVANKPLVNLHINPKSLDICKYEVHSLSRALTSQYTKYLKNVWKYLLPRKFGDVHGEHYIIDSLNDILLTLEKTKAILLMPE